MPHALFSCLTAFKVEPTFIEMLGLKQSLTPSRNNGFLNMLKLMQRKTLALVSDGNGSSSHSGTPSAPPSEPAPAAMSPQIIPEASTSGGDNSRTPVRDSVVRKLTEALKPTK